MDKQKNGKKEVEKANGKKESEKSIFGHQVGSQSAAIDGALAKGMTIDKMMEVLKLARPRIMGHEKHLRDAHEKEIKVEEKDGLYRASLKK